MISNSSPLIAFGKINSLNLLFEVLGEIKISSSVYREVVEKGKKIGAPDAILIDEKIGEKWIEVCDLDKKHELKCAAIRKIYSSINLGEAETIALALQKKQKEVLIDERIARKVSKLYGLKPRGSLYVLVLAYKKGAIDLDELNDYFVKLTSSQFRVGPEVVNDFWKKISRIKEKSR